MNLLRRQSRLLATLLSTSAICAFVPASPVQAQDITMPATSPAMLPENPGAAPAAAANQGNSGADTNGNSSDIGNPFDQPTVEGTYSNGEVTVVLNGGREPNTFTGTVARGSAVYPATATANGNRVNGDFAVPNGKHYSFTATLQDNDTMIFHSGNHDFSLTRQKSGQQSSRGSSSNSSGASAATEQSPSASGSSGMGNSSEGSPASNAGTPPPPHNSAQGNPQGNSAQSGRGGVGIVFAGPGSTQPLRIIELLAGGPADRAGARTGDVVVAIDGVPMSDLQKAMRLCGGPVGSQIRITVRHADGQTAELSITRAPLPAQPSR